MTLHMPHLPLRSWHVSASVPQGASASQRSYRSTQAYPNDGWGSIQHALLPAKPSPACTGMYSTTLQTRSNHRKPQPASFCPAAHSSCLPVLLLVVDKHANPWPTDQPATFAVGATACCWDVCAAGRISTAAPAWLPGATPNTSSLLSSAATDGCTCLPVARGSLLQAPATPLHAPLKQMLLRVPTSGRLQLVVQMLPFLAPKQKGSHGC